MKLAIHCPCAPCSPHLGSLCDGGIVESHRLALTPEAVTCKRCLARGPEVAERFEPSRFTGQTIAVEWS